MPIGSEDSDGDKFFTPDQRRRLIKMLEAHERAIERRLWLRQTFHIWVKWIGGVLAVMVAVKSLIGEHLRGLLR